ncbi:MAG TPA: hypothetical protein VHI14_08620 [Jatrophihabitantaceae bacterium]|nr:hypothetical protein [Jatrophihabitantaceae bacterium]
MDQPPHHRAQVREFLRSRRARIAPEQSGLPSSADQSAATLGRA